MGRKLILLFDGTWNNGKDKTNVFQLKNLLAEQDIDGNPQLARYITGVGTKPHTRILGGMFGAGLSDNIMDGYAWLCRNYRPGDEIYSFGFSRGAYTARSLAGIIRKCGLLTNPSNSQLKEADKLYRNKNAAPAKSLATQFRQAHSVETRVKFVGVWDTVGALGVPISGLPFSRKKYQWHDTELSKIVDYAYHAMAIDEHRKDFDVAVWENKLKPENIDVEQRWFIGAHANVGGGYEHDHLHRFALQWMIDKATATGLSFTDQVNIGRNDHLAGITDSFGDFMHGLYKNFKDRHHRRFGKGQNETVDDSVWQRWHGLPAYRPIVLAPLTPPDHPLE